jgi:hypothetical protein
MSGTWAGRFLGAIAGHPTTKSADAELEPMEPGAWNEWAREYRRPTGPAAPVAPPNTRVAPGRFELNAAVYMRGSGLRTAW